MAHGDECKTASKTTYAVKQMELPTAMKSPAISSSSKFYQPQKKEEKKDYGAWGSIYKDKKNFVDMHFC